MQEVYNIRSVLDVIFRVTNKNLNILADIYLLKDKSIISKWKSNKAVPRNDDIHKIVEFVTNECTLSQQKVIRDMIEELIKSEPAINNEIRSIIFNNSDFSAFLEEALSMSISMDTGNHKYQSNQKVQSPEGNYVTGNIEEQNGRYKGKLEFDLVLSQGSDSKSMHISSEQGMELNGNVKVTSKNSFIKAAKHIKKAASLGAVFLLIASGVIIATSFNNEQDDNLKVLGNVNQEGSDKTSMAGTVKPTLEPFPMTAPIYTQIPSHTPVLPKNTDELVKPTERVYENKGGGSKKRPPENNYDVQQKTIVSSGDNSVIIMGNQSSISIEKD